MRHWHKTTALDDQVSAVVEWVTTAGVAILLGLIAAHGFVMLVAAIWEVVRG